MKTSDKKSTSLEKMDLAGKLGMAFVTGPETARQVSKALDDLREMRIVEGDIADRLLIARVEAQIARHRKRFWLAVAIATGSGFFVGVLTSYLWHVAF